MPVAFSFPQFEATWCLTNVCSGDAVQTRCVVDAGVVPFLVRLLSSPSQLVREQAVWALGNIAGNGPEERDILLQVSAPGKLGPQSDEGFLLLRAALLQPGGGEGI